MGIISWLIVGLIAGWLASVVMKTNDEQGLIKDIIFGIIGAVVGGFVLNFFGYTGVTGLNIYSIGVATLGAIIVIFIGRRF